MHDVLLDKNGDLFIENMDVVVADSISQAISIRLRWFLGEWIFNKELGVDYYGELLVKNPSEQAIIGMLSKEILEVEGVLDIDELDISIDSNRRKANISYTALLVSGETLRKEVDIWQKISE